jgi:GDP-4-dehydro-6-deoxy-D-mannose reductase
VVAACRPGSATVGWHESPGAELEVIPLEITEDASVTQALRRRPDRVVHLAAIASVKESLNDPGAAWVVNAAGTARLVHAAARLRDAGSCDPLVLLVSSGEVYGAGGPAPRLETDPTLPCSSYAASKLAAEIAALEAWRRTGLRVIVARPFTHTGPGQSTRYLVPALVERLRAAKARGTTSIPTGNLAPVRDFLDVRDVVEAYIALLSFGAPGETYNIARGEGIALVDLFRRLTELFGVAVEPSQDPSLTRAADIPYLVGSSSKLRRATTWSPSIPLEQTLRELVNAEAD